MGFFQVFFVVGFFLVKNMNLVQRSYGKFNGINSNILPPKNQGKQNSICSYSVLATFPCVYSYGDYF